MAGIATIYTNQMKEQTNRFGVWLPNTKVELGDIGTVKDSMFHRIANIRAYGVEFEVSTGNKQPSKQQITSSGVRTVAVSIAADVPAIGVDGKIKLSFENENDFYLEYCGSQVDQIDNIVELGNDIKKLREQKKWERQWVVVTEVEKVDQSRIFISKSKQKGVEPGIEGSIELLNAEIGSKILSSYNVDTSLHYEEPTTLSFNAYRMSIFGFSPKSSARTKLFKHENRGICEDVDQNRPLIEVPMLEELSLTEFNEE